MATIQYLPLWSLFFLMSIAAAQTTRDWCFTWDSCFLAISNARYLEIAKTDCRTFMQDKTVTSIIPTETAFTTEVVTVYIPVNTIVNGKRQIGSPTTSAPTVAPAQTSLPYYASVCLGTERFETACECIGINAAATSTVYTKTTFKELSQTFVYVTHTSTKPGSSSTFYTATSLPGNGSVPVGGSGTSVLSSLVTGTGQSSNTQTSSGLSTSESTLSISTVFSSTLSAVSTNSSLASIETVTSTTEQIPSSTSQSSPSLSLSTSASGPPIVSYSTGVGFNSTSQSLAGTAASSLSTGYPMPSEQSDSSQIPGTTCSCWTTQPSLIVSSSLTSSFGTFAASGSSSGAFTASESSSTEVPKSSTTMTELSNSTSITVQTYPTGTSAISSSTGSAPTLPSASSSVASSSSASPPDSTSTLHSSSTISSTSSSPTTSCVSQANQGKPGTYFSRFCVRTI
ncbi:hypothetical protein BT63DRAFT_35963 [Microthyrium microscopicum]|uniref:Extracellular membrane protein CFEM domain-containing protein n=1 Tax=Microthyrium microscopicum TaxID=703497 RepID=A0A6A6UWD2_9PEZI|nr:hypothetical protein BT63DRAFT_35963 [Microthyrium microscopicum]